MGGVPKDPKIIEGWIKKSIGTDQGRDFALMVRRTLSELGHDVSIAEEDAEKALADIAGEKQTNGFKRDTGGLFLESRQVKAMLKESVNILFAGQRWGVTKKGPRSFFAERVFVNPDRIYFDGGSVTIGHLREPSGIELFIGHVSGPKGPQSNLTYIEFVERPRIEFEVIVLHDEIKPADWPEIWNHAEENGLGALRSQGFGRFDVERFEANGAQ